MPDWRCQQLDLNPHFFIGDFPQLSVAQQWVAEMRLRAYLERARKDYLRLTYA